MLRSKVQSALVALAVILGAGCASKPTMHLRHAEVSGVSLGFPPSINVVMTAVLDVYNPNSYDVAVRAVRGTVYFNNRYPMPIDYRAPGDGLWLPADQTTQIRVPQPIPVNLAFTLAREGMNQVNVPFRLTGRADVTATKTFKIEKDDYAIDENGTFSMSQLQMALPRFQ